MNIQNPLLRSVRVWDVHEGTRVSLFATYPLFTLCTGMNIQRSLRVQKFAHPELVQGNIYQAPPPYDTFQRKRNRWNSHDPWMTPGITVEYEDIGPFTNIGSGLSGMSGRISHALGLRGAITEGLGVDGLACSQQSTIKGHIFFDWERYL